MSLAESLKAEGNSHYGAGRYKEAIACYSRAIQHDPDNAVLYTNRAMAHQRQGDADAYDAAIRDCERAIELDPARYKAHYTLGQVLALVDRLSGAKRKLQIAYDLARTQDEKVALQIEVALRDVKKKHWEHEQQTMQTYHDEKLHKLASCIDSYFTQAVRNVQGNPYQPAAERAKQLEALEIERQALHGDTLMVFERVRDIMGVRGEIPDHFCCKISYEIMRDPVITPSGITYDRRSIIAHIMRSGSNDPITRAPLTAAMLYPNLALKDAIDDYIAKNPWVEVFEL